MVEIRSVEKSKAHYKIDFILSGKPGNNEVKTLFKMLVSLMDNMKFEEFEAKFRKIAIIPGVCNQTFRLSFNKQGEMIISPREASIC